MPTTTTTTVYAGPLRDRRQGRRLLTTKNALWTLLGLFVLFAAVSIASEFRSSKPGSFGRLYERREIGAPKAERVPAVVVEAPVQEETYADPLRLDTINREEVLGVTNPVNTKAAERDAWLQQQQISGAQTIPAPEQKLGFHGPESAEHRRARFAISGGATGVRTAPAQ